MRKIAWVVVAASGLLVGRVLFVQRGVPSGGAEREPEIVSQSTGLALADPDVPSFTTNLLTLDAYETLPYSLPTQEIRVLPLGFLRRYEGSYTAEEFASRSNQSRNLTLKSRWLGRTNLPQLDLSFRENPDTGEFEVSGGELFLQDKGYGVSYETDADTDESRTYFNLRKQF